VKSKKPACVNALFAICSAVLLLTSGCPTPTPQTGPQTGPKDTPAPSTKQPPKLVVLVVLDQLPTWSFEQKRPLYKAGLARLLRQSAYFKNAIYPYAATTTAAGHTALTTGAAPAQSGIGSNEWYDRSQKDDLKAVFDKTHPIFLAKGGGQTKKRGASPRHLRVEAVGDVLLRKNPKSRVVTISIKDRGAIFTGGKRPTMAVWYDSKQKAFSTSTYYAKTLPPWLEALAKKDPVEKHLSYVWHPLDKATLQRVAGPDKGLGEQPDYPLSPTFPHELSKHEKPHTAIKELPIADELLFRAAKAAMVEYKLGQDQHPDFFVISFSTTDYIGHRWGQESWEMHDEMMRIDLLLGKLLSHLDTTVGKGRYALLLSSDHGATRMVELTASKGHYARRVWPKVIEKAAEKAAASVFGPGDWIHGRVITPTLYLTNKALEQPAKKRDEAIDAIVAALRKIDGLGPVYRSDKLLGNCDKRKEPMATYCRAIVSGVSGEVFFAAKKDCSVMGPKGKPVTHGSPNPDDTTVPILLYAPNIKAKKTETPVSILQVAPTLAKLLGIQAPPAASKTALF
jgi:hypothetical protein